MVYAEGDTAYLVMIRLRSGEEPRMLTLNKSEAIRFAHELSDAEVGPVDDYCGVWIYEMTVGGPVELMETETEVAAL